MTFYNMLFCHFGMQNLWDRALVRTIIDRLTTHGFEAYVVGGAVRDLCLQRPITDWDIATEAPPEKIKSIFRDIRQFSLKHETVTLVHSGRHYEVSTFRGSGNSKLGIEEDLGHRDFTINAMAYDPKREVVLDPYGGRKDALTKVVRAVGKPEERFREDPLRLLRAVRLATELGFKIERRTLEAISTMADRLSSTARERIRDELMKILICRKPSAGFKLLVSTDLLKQFLPELLEGYLKRQNSDHRYTIYKHIMETVDRVPPDPVLRLTALLHDIAKPRVRKKVDGGYRFPRHEEASGRLAGEIMARLRFSNQMIGRVTHLIIHHTIGYDSGWGDGSVRRLISRVGPENMADLLSLREADLLAHGMMDEKLDNLSELRNRVEVLIEKAPALKTVDLAIDGHRVMEILGLPQGSEVGKALNSLLEKVIDQPELNTEEKLVELVQEMRRGNRKG